MAHIAWGLLATRRYLSPLALFAAAGLNGVRNNVLVTRRKVGKIVGSQYGLQSLFRSVKSRRPTSAEIIALVNGRNVQIRLGLLPDCTFLQSARNRWPRPPCCVCCCWQPRLRKFE